MSRIVRIICILVGILFIISGFVKAIDPLGFSYKLDEYFEVFAADTTKVAFLSSFFLWLKNFSVYLSMFFCVLEMVLGVMLIFGIQMQLTAWLLLLLIVFFTWLTGYSAITGKVTDCGCFGDAVRLTPRQSFNKDVVLLVLILIIFAFRNRVTPVFRKFGSLATFSVASLFFTWLTIYCFNHLPIIDFRAYKAGNDIRKQMELPPGKSPDTYATILTYKNKSSGETGNYVMTEMKDGEAEWLKEKNLKPLPWQDSLWMQDHEFVSSKSELLVAGELPKITDFQVWDNENKDVTALVLDEPGYHFWLVAYDMPKANKASFTRINELAVSSEKNQIPFVGLTSTSYEQLDPIRHELNAPFTFYYADGTVLKTIIRSNPGLVLLNGSTVIDHWHYNDIPTYDQVRSKYFK
ncbi:MAG: DoxX family protein [Chitinophagales bacterium]|nr:DoxX family protein [Chitinophagales bacterium]